MTFLSSFIANVAVWIDLSRGVLFDGFGFSFLLLCFYFSQVLLYSCFLLFSWRCRWWKVGSKFSCLVCLLHVYIVYVCSKLSSTTAPIMSRSLSHKKKRKGSADDGSRLRTHYSTTLRMGLPPCPEVPNITLEQGNSALSKVW